MTPHSPGLLPLRPRPAPAAPAWSDARIAQCLAPGRFRLDDGRLAVQATSCLLVPAAGDSVLAVQADGGLYVVHVLARPGQAVDGEPVTAQLTVPGADVLQIVQPGVQIACTGEIGLRSLGDVALASAGGSVSLTARHVVASATETLVQNAQHLVTHAQHCVMQIARLLRIHGQQALLTAEQDMKLDAERISLG